MLRDAHRHGQAVDVHALDASPAVLREAKSYLRDAPVTLHLGDARALPFEDRAFDIVTCVLALHHFPRDEAVAVLGEIARVSRHAWLVMDISRGLLAYLGALSLRPLLRNPMTRHDAPASVLRAYTLAELDGMLREAGLSSATLGTYFPFRVAVLGRAAASGES